MMQKRILAGALCIAAALTAQTVMGAGFGLYEGSARGNAIAMEVTADPASPSVLYNNAAAMTELPGTQIEAGATVIRPSATIVAQTPAGPVTTKAKTQNWVIPHAYATHQISDRTWAGVGLFSRFGLGNKYEDDWIGRYNVQEVEIRGFEGNPSVAFKVLDNVSVAAGLRAQYFHLHTLNRAVPYDPANPSPATDFKLELSGDPNIALGYNLAVFFEPTSWLALGLAYDSRVKQDVEGDYALISATGQTVATGEGGGEVTLPDIIRLGASIQATDHLKINAGFIYTMWSTYDELAIEFDPPLLGSISESVTEKNWKDVFRYQIGAEYALNELWSLRAGYIYDRTPDPDAHVDYLIPGNHRNLFSLGAGYQKNNFFCDVSYNYLYNYSRRVEGRPQDGVFPGEFKDGDAHMVGLTVGYRL